MKSPLVLASSSKPRKALLERLKLPFQIMNPDIDESPLPGEKPEEMVIRLAQQKARVVADHFPNAWIIGADQVGVCENIILGKPLTDDAAVQQLQFMSDKKIRFLIGLCLLNANNDSCQLAVETVDVKFRLLTPSLITYYLQNENALQCAGSFKVEGLGISLVEKLEGNDYTALIGLPLIRLVSMLEKANLMDYEVVK